ncbi:MAG: hypothetical protein ABI045_03880 [Flavobacteriales bacterium]
MVKSSGPKNDDNWVYGDLSSTKKLLSPPTADGKQLDTTVQLSQFYQAD